MTPSNIDRQVRKKATVIKPLRPKSHQTRVRPSQRCKYTRAYLHIKTTHPYRSINPTLEHHNIYKNNNIDDQKRISCTRFRVGSHRLKIETGRWSRTPKHERLCSCLNGIQDENHVIFHCTQTETFRLKFNILDFTNMTTFFNSDAKTLTKFIYEVNEHFIHT